MRHSPSLLLALSFSAGVAWADVEPDLERPPRQPVSARLQVIKTRDQAYRLVIPRNLLDKTTRQLGAAEPSRSTWRSVAVGIALSGCLASLVLVRRRRAAALAMVVGAALLASGWGASHWAYANLAPPEDFKPGPPAAGVKVTIEAGPAGNTVRLYAPRLEAAVGDGAAEDHSALQGLDGDPRPGGAPADAGRPALPKAAQAPLEKD